MKKFSFFKIHLFVASLIVFLISSFVSINVQNVFQSTSIEVESALILNNRRKKQLLHTLGSFSYVKILNKKTKIHPNFYERFLVSLLPTNLGLKRPSSFNHLILMEINNPNRDEILFQNFEKEIVVDEPTPWRLKENIPFAKQIGLLLDFLKKPWVQTIFDFDQFMLGLNEATENFSIVNNPQNDPVPVNELLTFLSSTNYAELIKNLKSLKKNFDMLPLIDFFLKTNPDNIMNEIYGFVNSTFLSQFTKLMSEQYHKVQKNFETVWRGELEELFESRFEPTNLVRKILQTVNFFIEGFSNIEPDDPADKTAFSNSQIYRLLVYLEKNHEIILSDQTFTLESDEEASENIENSVTLGSIKTKAKAGSIDAPQATYVAIKKFIFKKIGKGFLEKLISFSDDIGLFSADNEDDSKELQSILKTLFYGPKSTETNNEQNSDIDTDSESQLNETFFNNFLKIFETFIFTILNENFEKNNVYEEGKLTFLINSVVASLKDFSFDAAEMGFFIDGIEEHAETLKNQLIDGAQNPDSYTNIPTFKQLISKFDKFTADYLISFIKPPIQYLQRNFIKQINLPSIMLILQLYEINLKGFSDIVNDDDFWKKLNDKLTEIKKLIKKFRNYNENRDGSNASNDDVRAIARGENMQVYGSINQIFFQIMYMVVEKFGSDDLPDSKLNLRMIFNIIEQIFTDHNSKFNLMTEHGLQLSKLIFQRITYKDFVTFLKFFFYYTGRLAKATYNTFSFAAACLKTSKINISWGTCYPSGIMISEIFFNVLAGTETEKIQKIVNEFHQHTHTQIIVPIKFETNSLNDDFIMLIKKIQKKLNLDQSTSDSSFSQTILEQTSPVSIEENEEEEETEVLTPFRENEKLIFDFWDTAWDPMLSKTEISTLISDFADLSPIFLKNSFSFGDELLSVITRELDKKFYYFLDFNNWEFWDLTLEPFLLENSEYFSKKDYQIASFKAILKINDKIIFAFDFSWKINLANSSAILISWNQLDSTTLSDLSIITEPLEIIDLSPT